MEPGTLFACGRRTDSVFHVMKKETHFLFTSLRTEVNAQLGSSVQLLTWWPKFDGFTIQRLEYGAFTPCLPLLILG